MLTGLIHELEQVLALPCGHSCTNSLQSV